MPFPRVKRIQDLTHQVCVHVLVLAFGYTFYMQESLVAVLVGAVTLQGPLLLWLHRQKYTVCNNATVAGRP